MLEGTVDSSALEIVYEETEEDGGGHKVLLKVFNKETWSKHVLQMLRSQEEEPFGISIRKEYYLQEGTPSFIWVILIWGEVEEAVEEISSILNQSPPVAEPSKPVRPSPPKAARRVNRQTVRTSEGTREITTIPLPHYAGPRTIDPGAVKKFGSRGFGATVSNLNDPGGV